MKIKWNGHPKLPIYRRKLRKVVKFAQRYHTATYITSTTDGVHSSGSYHYQKRAVDWGSADYIFNQPERNLQEALLEEFGASYFRELFGPQPWHVKDGVKRAGIFPAHGDHDHAAV